MILITNRLAPLGHPEFEIQLNNHELAQGDFDFLHNTLFEMVQQGARLQPGELIQIGWIPCRIAQSGALLSLEEPDFQVLPLRWTQGATTTMMHLRIQNYVAQSLDLLSEQQHPSILQSSVFCNRLSYSSGLLMERVTPEDETDSGWNILCSDREHVHDEHSLRRESLYAVSSMNEEVFRYVSLPPESALILPPGGIPHFFYQGASRPIQKQSYLAQRFLSIRPLKG